ncbi:MAG: Xaa-Pro dipeptidyl-peptidase [Planctomycetes bacterium]|nr:Xaa-Pro dipeptidyl-peptidase [Planctomycetota bacterium]
MIKSTISLAASIATTLGAGNALAQDSAEPVFEDGQAQVVEAFRDSDQWIRQRLWIETEFDSDGDGRPDRVHVDVTRQAQTDTQGLKVPVVYETSPYYAGTGTTDSKYFWDPRQELGTDPAERNPMPPIGYRDDKSSISRSLVKTWVPRGFAVVHSESPGTGQSQGCPTVGGSNEALAPKAVIDWLNGRAMGYTTPDGDEEVKADWSTGKVGMTGTSYNGTLPLAAATTGVDGLEAVIPVAANTSYYHYYRSNGLIRHPGGYMGEDIDVLYDFINSGNAERREYCDCEVRDKEMAEGFDRVSGDYNEFWAGRDYANQLGPLKAATLMAHGLNDWNVMPAHSVRIYEAIKAKGVPCQLFLHQGGHGGPPPLELMNRWFTRYLYGVENGVEDDPRAWIVREGDRRSKPTPYAEYPNPQAEHVRLHLGAGGAEAGTLSAEATPGQGQETLVDDASVTGAKLAAANGSPHRLLYATPELTAPVHISGTARLDIRLACNRPAANLSVWVVSLPWTPRDKPNANIITRGWADPQNHASLTESAPLAPGDFYDLSFDLQPDDQIIPAGARIGLMVFSSDHDFTLWPAPGTELTVDLDATSLTLPVVGGLAALEKATSE